MAAQFKVVAELHLVCNRVRNMLFPTHVTQNENPQDGGLGEKADGLY